MATTTPKQKGRDSGKSATPTTRPDHTAPTFHMSPALTTELASTSGLTMSSRDIADLTGKRHDNVMADIRSMFSELGADVLKFQGIYTDGRNRQQQEFRLPKRETLILVSGYSVQLRTRIIDRWQKLEEQAAQSAIAVPQTLPEALRLAADLADANVRLTHTVQHQAAKVAALDQLASADGSMCVTDAAKTLKVAPRALITWLDRNAWTYRRSGGAQIAYQAAIMRGLLEHASRTIQLKDGTDKAVSSVRVTPKGLAELARKVANGVIRSQGGGR
jgi:phage antirepressor YoqD-like protein